MNSVAEMAAKGFGERPRNVNLSMVYDPMSQSFTGDGRQILPHQARIFSPVKITLEPDTKRYQSLVANRARSATFKLRPLKSGERGRPEFRFKPPEATAATVQFLSPWVSITKGDYRDPRMVTPDDRFNYRNIPSGMSSIYKLDESDYPHDYPLTAETPTSQLDGKSDRESKGIVPSPKPILTSMSSFDRTPNRSPLGTADKPSTSSLRGDSRKSSKGNGRTSVAKRVTICSPRSGCVSVSGNNAELASPSMKSVPEISRQAWQNAPLGAKSTNYYSGYLPPELSEKIAHDLNIVHQVDTSSPVYENPIYTQDPYFKPLVGDRSAFLHEQYPSVGKVQLSAIEKARLEGHTRLLKSRGIHPSQFSGLDDRARVYRTFAPKVNLNEAMRQRQRQVNPKSSAPIPSRIQSNVVKSMDLFDSQMKKTYEMQASMKQMLKE